MENESKENGFVWPLIVGTQQGTAIEYILMTARSIEYPDCIGKRRLCMEEQDYY